MLDLLRQDPITFLRFILYRAPAVLIALTLHELGHGVTAYLCGDNTAKNAGRLSLNPARHLSLIGTILMFTAGMGWAKPVPVNPRNYRHGVRDDFFVSIAGVTVNFILFCLSSLLSVGLFRLLITDPYLNHYGYPFFLSFDGDGFWYLLLTPAAEMEDVLRTPWLLHVFRFLFQFSLCNLGMCLFNLLPIPPLDGFHVFNDLILRGKIRLSAQAFQACMLALLLVMSLTNVVSSAITSVEYAVQNGVLSACCAVLGVG